MTPADRSGDLEQRVTALEAAVSELRQKPSATAHHSPADSSRADSSPADSSPADAEPGGSAPAALDRDTFWALLGLRERLPEGTGAVLFTGRVGAPGGVYEWQETHPHDELMDTGWDEAGTSLAALASPARMSLLREVLAGHETAAELAALEGFGTSGQVYHHLRQLTAAGWLRSASRGRYVVPPERVVPLLTIVAAARR